MGLGLPFNSMVHKNMLNGRNFGNAFWILAGAVGLFLVVHQAGGV
jgi:hypothetical protein